jgi:signal transduction histidine kinase/ActR/RegA family two-component response regulator
MRPSPSPDPEHSRAEPEPTALDEPRDGAAKAPDEDEATLRRLCAEEMWPKDRRYSRVIAAAALAANALAWFANYTLLGFSRRGLAILSLNVLAALSALPWLLATWKARPPRWQDAAKLAYIAISTGGTILVMQLNPTHISMQGWSMVATWTLVSLLIRVPVRPKVALNLATFVLYVAHLALTVASRGDGYATTHEVVVVLVCGALAALVLPWVLHRLDEQRFHEFVMRRRITQRERELVAEKVRADRAAEEARRAARRAAREARLRTELFANMTHDLRTPMAGILGIVELMRDTPLTEEQKGFIETIRASNQTLLSLLDDVIDFARLEEGRLPVVLVASPLIETLKRPADLVRVAAERKGLAMRVDLPADLPAYVKLDPARVQQILLNLLGNAVKFTQGGSVKLSARWNAIEGERAALRVEIRDTGIGFTEEQAARLFQRFSQAEDATAHKFGGSGLGLSICKGLVELMGGAIGADGEPGRGACFWFEIPAEKAQPPSGADAGTAVPSLRLLLAEDNPVNQLVLSSMLKKLGQQVTVAGDGEQTLRLLREERFDLAIMDMKMPVMDGDEVTRRLRDATGGASLTYIVALTAGATAEQQAEYRAAGVDAIYTKPIDMDGLRRMLVKEGAAAEVRRKGLVARVPAAPVPAANIGS